MATTGELAGLSASIARSEAFRRLADRHLESSYRLARAILRDPAPAKIVVVDGSGTVAHVFTYVLPTPDELTDIRSGLRR